MIQRFDDDVLRVLYSSGWHPERVALFSEIERFEKYLFPAAREVLVSFCGLHIGKCGPGLECATSDINFNPYETTHIFEELQEYEKRIDCRLFPLGEMHRAHGFLLIDEKGRIYLLDDDIEYYAHSFDRALVKCVKGILPDEPSTPIPF